MKLFLDMDNVLADFIGGICKLHGRPNPWIENPEEQCDCLQTIWGREKGEKMSDDEFWGPVDLKFWTKLQVCEGAEELVEQAHEIFPSGLHDVCVLSSPTIHGSGCVQGKMLWLKKHFPELYRNSIFTKKKRLLAGPDAVLIDDWIRNVREFRQAGGIGIHWPAHHNSRRRELGRTSLKEELDWIGE